MSRAPSTDADAIPAVTPVALLTGFLGSGKTTLLTRALSAPYMRRTAVVVNEFGAIGLDHLLIAKTTENVIELRNGCLCCTIRGDLALTLRDLHRKRLLGEIPPFDYVVIETSGLADPVPLVHTLMADTPLRRAYVLDAVLTVVDAANFEATVAEHDTAASQLAIADVVLLTKTDLVGEERHDSVTRHVRAHNPGAELYTVVAGAIEPQRLFRRRLFDPDPVASALGRWLTAASASPDVADHLHGDGYGAHAIVRPGPLSLAGTSVFLNRLVNEQRDAVLRIKGLAGFREKGGRPAMLHAVREKFYPVEWLDEWPDSDHSSRLIFIGRRLDIARLEELFAGLCA